GEIGPRALRESLEVPPVVPPWGYREDRSVWMRVPALRLPDKTVMAQTVLLADAWNGTRRDAGERATVAQTLEHANGRPPHPPPPAGTNRPVRHAALPRARRQP